MAGAADRHIIWAAELEAFNLESASAKGATRAKPRSWGSFAVALCEGEVQGSAASGPTASAGNGGAQHPLLSRHGKPTPDSLIEATRVGQTPGYRRLCYLVLSGSRSASSATVSPIFRWNSAAPWASWSRPCGR
jgi:hypothetical protein